MGKSDQQSDRLKMYADLNRKSKKERDAEYYKLNSDKIKASTKAWKAKNPDRKRELNREYKKRNKAKVNANTKLYKQRNRGVTNANTAKRRAALLQRTPKWLTPLDFTHIKLFYDCAADMTKVIGIDFEVDHIIPLQGELMSGLHIASNLQVITAFENQAKNNRIKI
jgi:hypothetical protein